MEQAGNDLCLLFVCVCMCLWRTGDRKWADDNHTQHSSWAAGLLTMIKDIIVVHYFPHEDPKCEFHYDTKTAHA